MSSQVTQPLEFYIVLVFRQRAGENTIQFTHACYVSYCPFILFCFLFDVRYHLCVSCSRRRLGLRIPPTRSFSVLSVLVARLTVSFRILVPCFPSSLQGCCNPLQPLHLYLMIPTICAKNLRTDSSKMVINVLRYRTRYNRQWQMRPLQMI